MYVAEHRPLPALGREEEEVVRAFLRGIEVGRSASITTHRLRQLFGFAMKSTTQGVRG